MVTSPTPTTVSWLHTIATLSATGTQWYPTGNQSEHFITRHPRYQCHYLLAGGPTDILTRVELLEMAAKVGVMQVTSDLSDSQIISSIRARLPTAMPQEYMAAVASGLVTHNSGCTSADLHSLQVKYLFLRTVPTNSSTVEKLLVRLQEVGSQLRSPEAKSTLGRYIAECLVTRVERRVVGLLNNEIRKADTGNLMPVIMATVLGQQDSSRIAQAVDEMNKLALQVDKLLGMARGFLLSATVAARK